MHGSSDHGAGALGGIGVGPHSYTGLIGIVGGHSTFGVIDTMDLLEGGSRDGRQVADPMGAESGLFVSEDKNLFAVRMRHDGVNIRDMLKALAGKAGLMKVGINVSSFRTIDETHPKILPVNAWSGAVKGEMPYGYRPGMTGETAMFRFAYQVPERRWGELSTPTIDKEAGVYLDIAGMTWTMRGCDFRLTQLLIRVVPLTTLEPRRKVWGMRTSKVDAIGKIAAGLARGMFDRMSFYEVVVATEVAEVPAAPVVELPVPQPRATGVDLWSALNAAPKLGVIQGIAAGIPSDTASGPHTGPVLESELVVVRVALPRRRPAG